MERKAAPVKAPEPKPEPAEPEVKQQSASDRMAFFRQAAEQEKKDEEKKKAKEEQRQRLASAPTVMETPKKEEPEIKDSEKVRNA